MKIVTIIGIILIVIGAAGLIWGGINYTSGRNTVDMGGMHLEVDQTRHIPFSPIGGALALVGGIILILVGRRQPATE